MAMTDTAPELSVIRIADYLIFKREAIFNSWRSRVDADISHQSASSLTRAEFNDQMPIILNILQERLCQKPSQNDPIAVAGQHGLHRWHKGYALSDLLSEIAHLHYVLSCELERYSCSVEAIDSSALSHAHTIITTLMHEVVQGSVAQYSLLQQQEATQRADNLQEALQSLNELTQQRGDVLRQASHDLRSQFSLVRGAAWQLDQPGSDEEKAQWHNMWQRNLTAATTLLTELMDLARLETGQETLQIEALDAGQLLHDIAEMIQPLAAERALLLEWAGPTSLPIEGDRIKLQRIVQNLLVNALNHTQRGRISLSWSREADFRWVLSVQDTGPGLPTDVVERLGKSLVPVADSTRVLETIPMNNPAYQVQANPSVPLSRGEGIGLLIVKRLCEVLKASLDIETQPEIGTIFRVIIPTHYLKLG